MTPLDHDYLISQLEDLLGDAIAWGLEDEASQRRALAAVKAWVPIGKPHLTLVRSAGLWPIRHDGAMWRCQGPFGAVTYGPTPADAYRNWRQAMARPGRYNTSIA